MSAWEFRVAASAERALARISPRVAAAVVGFMTGPLLEAPHRVGKPLQRELAGYRSARVGAFRIVYAIDDENRAVLVVLIDHPSDVYRRR